MIVRVSVVVNFTSVALLYDVIKWWISGTNKCSSVISLVFFYIIINLLLHFFFYCIYRNLRDEAKPDPYSDMEPLELHNQVLQYNAEAFEYVTPGKQSILSCSFIFYLLLL